MQKYETMLVTSATLDEEAATALVNRFKSLIEKNGTIESVEEWGKRRLTYPINKEDDGVYTLIHFSSEPTFPAELDRRYKITDGVLRSLIIAKTDEQLLAEAKAEKAKEAQAKAAAARAEAAAAEKAAAEKAAAEKAAAEKAAAEAAAEAAQPAQAETEQAPAAEQETE